MRIIRVEPYDNGAHANQQTSGTIVPPDGWAVIPADMEIPETFPFVNVTAENGVVTSLTPGIVPEPEPVPPPEPTLEERNRADIDYISIMTGVELL